MAIRFPGSGANYLRLDASGLNTGALSVFARFIVEEEGDFDLIALDSGSSSQWVGGGSPGSGTNYCPFFIEGNGDGTFDISPGAFWESLSGPVATDVPLGAVVDVAVIGHTVTDDPAFKIAVRVNGGSLQTMVYTQSWWNTYYQHWTIPRISIGGSSNATAMDGVAMCAVIYGASYLSDSDILAQFNANGAAALSSPYFVTSMLGYPNVAAAVAKESGSSSLTDWTVIGTLSVDNSLDPVSEIEGELTKTLSAATLTATGKLDIAGTLTKTLAPATLTATGQVPATGALTKTLAPATLAATGKLDIAGSLSKTLAPATITAAGELGPVPNTGTAENTLDPATLTATGVLDTTAEANVTLAAATLAATGKLDIAGQVTATLAAATLDAQGTAQDVIVGELAATLAPATLSAAGSVDIAGALGITLKDAILVSGAALEIQGALVATLAPATLDAQGQELPQRVAELNVTLAPAVLAADAVLSIPGVVYPPLTPADIQQYLRERHKEPRRHRPLTTEETIFWSQRADYLERKRQGT